MLLKVYYDIGIPTPFWLEINHEDIWLWSDDECLAEHPSLEDALADLEAILP